MNNNEFGIGPADKCAGIKKDQDGMTLVEVMIAILIFLIIMVGGMNYFIQPQVIIARQKIERLAIMAAHSRLETILALNYDDITTALNEKGVKIVLAKITGVRKTTIKYVDDPADGKGLSDKDGETIDYKTITVKIAWPGVKNRSLVLSTKVSGFEK
ncbi:MAG: prepilin-type N-terminal cleavage/methylation domain-containing protein [bacterium]